jgi:hypothetical protein
VLFWRKKDSQNLETITKSFVVIAKSLSILVGLEEFVELPPKKGPIEKMEFSSYNAEKEFNEELEELEENRKKKAAISEQRWVEDELDLEEI